MVKASILWKKDNNKKLRQIKLQKGNARPQQEAKMMMREKTTRRFQEPTTLQSMLI